MSALPRDPGLPTLGLLLDAGRMTFVLARSLGRQAQLDQVQVARIAYKPGDRVVVHYRALVDGQREDAVGRAVAGRDLAARLESPAYQQLAARIDGTSPAASPVVYDAEANALVSWLPFDPGLPALAQSPDALALELREAGLPDTGDPHEGVVLSYRPDRRIALRVGSRVLKAYGSDRQYERAVSGLRAGSEARLPTPRFEGALPSLLLTVQSAVEGVAPASSEEAAVEAGALVRDLQASVVSTLEPAQPEEQLATAARKAELVRTVVPALAGRLERLVGRLEAGMPSVSELVPAHGDFHARQLLRVGGGLVVLDLDAMRLAPAALDLAEYAAEVADRGEAGLDAVEGVLERLLEGYGARPASLQWHLAAAVLVRTSHPFHRLTPAWPERIEALVDIAEAVLEEGTR